MEREFIDSTVSAVMDRVGMQRDYDVFESDGRWIVHIYSYVGEKPVSSRFAVYPTWDERDIELEVKECLLSLESYETHVKLYSI